MRTILAAVVLISLKPLADQPRVSAAPRTPGATAPSVASADEEFFKRWSEAVERQIEADARAARTRAWKSHEEVKAFLLSLTPSGFRPRPEFFAGLSAKPEDIAASVKRAAAYAEAHPEAVQRWIAAFAARIEPLLQRISVNVQKQTPLRWQSDPLAALADARKRKRGTLMVFCAEWAMACKELEQNLSDPSVQAALDRSFVAVRIDQTDSDAPAAKQNERTYRIKGLPLLLVFDKKGREVARRTELVGVTGLLTLLRGAE